MNQNDLYRAIGEVDDTLLLRGEAAPRRRKRWIGFVAAAACVCVCLAVGGGILWRNQQPQPDPLPLLRVSDRLSEGMGYEGAWCYDIQELDNGNPWQEMTSVTLPVYQNRAYHPNVDDAPPGLTEDEMRERLVAACQKLGVTVTQIEYEQRFGSMHMKSGDVTVSADADGRIHVTFENGVDLPDNLHFTWYDTTPQEAEEALTYLAQQYADLLGFEQPTPATWGDYNIYAQFNREYIIYEGVADATQNFLNYQMRYANFYPNSKGQLGGIWICDPLSCADKIGDYPIITAAQAQELLLAGCYITNASEDVGDDPLVARVELCYRTTSLDEVLMPYYRFLVKLSGDDTPGMQYMRDMGLSDYGAYYVPAVEEQYIENMPVWDGRWNY